MTALAGYIGDSPQVFFSSFRDSQIGVNVRIFKATNGETIVDEYVTLKAPGGDAESTNNYDLSDSETYRITVITDDGIINHYRWDIPSFAGHHILHVEIEDSDIEFGISMP